MFESKDASKSDERRVKNTPYSKPLTRKRKGETHTMGNRGTQLSVFFVISLMLIAGLFSNTAMAADGDGEITAQWATHTVITAADTDGTPPAAADGFTVTTTGTSLAAGSKLNALQFTYTEFTDVTDEGVTTDTEGADGNDTPIDMAGGRIRISIPAGWTVPDKVLVQDDAANTTAEDIVTLYDTRGEEQAVTDKKRLGMVTFKANSHIIVDLGPEWSHNERPDVAGIGREAPDYALSGNYAYPCCC